MTRAWASRKAQFTLAVGMVVFWAAQSVLSRFFGLALLDTLLLGILLIVVPAFSIAQLPMIEEETIERLPAYLASILSLWFLGTLCWLVGTRTDGPAAIGLVMIRPGALVTWATVLTAAAFGVILFFRQVAIWTNTPDTPLLRQLLPRTPREQGTFALLSFAAGFGEELAYRGYTISVLAPVTGVTGAAALSTLAFGIVHGYQGALGVLRTGIMGAVLAWGFLASGSLWPAIIAHTLIDLLAGIVYGERLLSPEGAGGCDAALPQSEHPWK